MFDEKRKKERKKKQCRRRKLIWKQILGSITKINIVRGEGMTTE